MILLCTRGERISMNGSLSLVSFCGMAANVGMLLGSPSRASETWRVLCQGPYLSCHGEFTPRVGVSAFTPSEAAMKSIALGEDTAFFIVCRMFSVVRDVFTLTFRREAISQKHKDVSSRHGRCNRRSFL